VAGEKKIHIGVIRLPRISNFTDFDPLQNELDVMLRYVDEPDQMQGLDILIIPGSKSTIADLTFLRERGLYDIIRDFNGHIIGICGGFQMLGTSVLDPDGVESSVAEAQGLDLLPSTTLLMGEKETHQAQAHLEEAGLLVAPDCFGAMTGYEIHMGVTTLGDGLRPFSRIFQRGSAAVAVEDGAVSSDGRVFGTYLHGLFENDLFVDTYLDRIRREKGLPLRRGAAKQPLRDPFDQLAEQFEKHLDLPRLLAICGFSSDSN
jgi:adenosylcobyric acid synthase